MKSRSEVISLGLSIAMHTFLALMLFLSIEKTIYVPEASSSPQEIIEASVVSSHALQEEISRLEEKEEQKKLKEQERLDALTKREKESKEKRLQEEQLALELKKTNEILKQQAEQKRLALQQDEIAREKKLKAEKAELAKLQKEKEAAVVAKKKAEAEEKKKAETQKAAAAEKKTADEDGANQNNETLNQDEISRHAQLIRKKINQNWRQPLGMDSTGMSCKIAVKLMPGGEVVDAQVIESSGSLELDRSAELAVHKSSPLPMPSNEDVAKVFRNFTFTFRPEAT